MGRRPRACAVRALRNDLPLHDMTGGNYWMPAAIQYLDSQGKLLLGGALSAAERAALDAGVTRVKAGLDSAAALEVAGDVVKVFNLTGHKLISGYPEGRRVWLNVKWYDAAGLLLREDGAYGPIPVTLDGQARTVDSLLDLHDPNAKIYEVHGAITQAWAAQLLSYGYPRELPVACDRHSGAVTVTLGEVADQPLGSYHESLHFVLNNHVAFDDRIPPYGMRYDDAVVRNIRPVPYEQYGSPAPGETYRHWDEVTLSPPAGAQRGDISLLFQPTSSEYVQFLYLANTGASPFLANAGRYLLEAWLATGMAAPHVMAKATWSSGAQPPPPAPLPTIVVDSLTTWSVDGPGNLLSVTDTFTRGARVGVQVHTVSTDGQPLAGARVSVEIRDANGAVVLSLQATSDAAGNAVMYWQTTAPWGRRQLGTAAGTSSVVVTDVALAGYTLDAAASLTTASFVLQ